MYCIFGHARANDDHSVSAGLSHAFQRNDLGRKEGTKSLVRIGQGLTYLNSQQELPLRDCIADPKANSSYHLSLLCSSLNPNLGKPPLVGEEPT